METNMGVPASPSGCSAEPGPISVVPAVPVSIPNAVRDQTLHAWTSVGDYKNYPQLMNVSLEDGRVKVIVRSLETIDPDKGWPVTGAWAEAVIPAGELRRFADAFSRAASAIEARSGETTEIGSTEGESAVAASETPNLSPQGHSHE